jgi:hypothetical protein
LIINNVFIEQSYSLTPQGPQIRNFESENGFEKVLQLATKLVQIVKDQSYSLTPQGPIRQKIPSPDNRAHRPLDRLLDRF